MPTYKKSSDNIVVTFMGTLDTTTCIGFEDELFEQLEDFSGQVVFDLKDVISISSMFLRFCTKAYRKIDNENLSIINTPPQAMKVFKITKLDSFFNISE